MVRIKSLTLALFMTMTTLALLAAACAGQDTTPGAPEAASESADAYSAASEAGTSADSADAVSSSSLPQATNEAWMAAFAYEASTHALTAQGGRGSSSYGGSEAFPRRELMPELDVNFLGSAFAVEYHEDRGHANAWKDLTLTKRRTAKTPAACMTCKTSAVAEVFASEGWAYASKPLSEYEAIGHGGISCSSCHDLSSGHLRPVQPGFLDAIARAGKDLAAATETELSVYSCAQCHSEYYFEPSTVRVVHPWDQGLSAASMYRYYAAKPAGFAGDFTQPDSGAPLLKAQHPDYEEYSQGVHAAAGVSCADCHMPRSADGRSHRVASPLETIESTCMACHGDKSPQWLAARVKDTQDSVFGSQRDAGQAVAQAHKAIASAQKAGVKAELIEKARLLVREAQWHWDYVASANSMGFHAPVAALSNLAKATDLAYKAQLALTGR